MIRCSAKLNGGKRFRCSDHVSKSEYSNHPVDPRGLTNVRTQTASCGSARFRCPYIELIFNEGPNDLFVIRVAGNGLGMEVLEQLEIRSGSPGWHLEAYCSARAQRMWGSHCSRRCVSKPGRLRGDCRNAFNSEYSRPVTYRRSGIGKQTALGVRSRRHAQPGIPAGTDRGIDCHQCCAFGLLDPARVRRLTTCRNCRQSTAFTFSRPARYGRRAQAASRELDWPHHRAISPNLPPLPTRLFNRSELALI